MAHFTYRDYRGKLRFVPENMRPSSTTVDTRGYAAAGSTNEINFETFPSTRYQGSKRKILPWLHERLAQLEFNSALDIFGGTSAVSYLLKRMGKAVIYNDILQFNYLTGVALIENNRVTLSADDLDFLMRPREAETFPRFIENTFTGFYYTDAENRQLDLLSSRISQLADHGDTGTYKAAIASHALFQTCLVKRPFNLFHRKNLYLRLADVDRSFGNKRTWDYPLRKHFTQFVAEANACIFEGAQDISSLRRFVNASARNHSSSAN